MLNNQEQPKLQRQTQSTQTTFFQQKKTMCGEQRLINQNKQEHYSRICCRKHNSFVRFVQTLRTDSATNLYNVHTCTVNDSHTAWKDRSNLHDKRGMY